MARKLNIIDDVEAGTIPQNITTIPMNSDVLSLAQLPVSPFLTTTKYLTQEIPEYVIYRVS